MKPVYNKKTNEVLKLLLDYQDGEWYDWFDRNEFEHCCGCTEVGNFEDIFYKIDNFSNRESWNYMADMVELKPTTGELLGAFAKLMRIMIPKLVDYLIEDDGYGCVLFTTVPKDGGWEQAVAETVLRENRFQKAGREFRGKTGNRINLWMLRKERYRGAK